MSSELSRLLRQLAVDVELDGDLLDDAMSGLIIWVQRAVPSSCGLQITVMDHGWPVTITEITGPAEWRPATSVRVGLAALAGRTTLEGHITFYATTPGAFAELASDLGHALGVPVVAGPTDSADREASEADESAAAPVQDEATGAAIELDAVRLPTDMTPGIVGLAELSLINQAVGLLIDRGHRLDDAHATIRGGARSAGLAAHVFAAQLLFTDPGGSDGIDA